MVFDIVERNPNTRGMTMASRKLYDERELFEEIKWSIEEVGGEIEIIDRFHNLFRIIIAPELKEHANLLIQDTIDKYTVRRARLHAKDPFTGVKIFIKDIQGYKQHDYSIR